MTKRPDLSPADTQPYEVAAERLVADDPDTVAETRPLPEPDTVSAEVRRGRAEAMPTIGHIGRYALKYTIGEGGLGTVYAAHDPLLSRLIAIKTLHVDLPVSDREQFNALFLNEAKAAGSLNHPHIVTMYDAGTSEQGTYIAMEMLRGKDLRQLLASDWKPTAVQAALIVRRVADALSYAHHKGVIHRDIKPANIFMVGRTQPRVLDFGIARIRQAESLAQRDDPQSRFQDIVGGSPYYMAPEQVLHQPVDRRVDVYALGVVLYELLVGRRAYGGNSLEEIAEAVLRKPVPLVHELNPEVPRALSEIVARAMHRDLAQRTRSARRLSQELRDWLAQAENEAALKGRAALPVARKGLRQRLWPLLASGWVLALGGVAWMSWREAHEESPSPVTSALAASTVARTSPSAAPPASTADVPTQAPSGALAAAVPPVSPGVVKLAVSPWGAVLVDGREVGLTPPLNQLSLSPGEHTIVIRNGDAPEVRQTVVVQAGKSVQIKHHF